jgi:signal transduction histidine kinase
VWPVDGDRLSQAILRTGRPAREDDWRSGVRCSVASPIVVEGRVWGGLWVHSTTTRALPAETESRLGSFTELVATAILNIQARSDLAASRERIVAAADAERRRVVRDLHDGAQQRLVHTVVTLGLARQALENDQAAARAQVIEALEQARRATHELRELSHGIMPAVLTRGGLRQGVEALGSRASVPVEIDVPDGRLPSPIEATAYFIVSEALTNVSKHARARSATIKARIEDEVLRVEVADDGVGGARSEGSGLVGLRDRVAALDGRLRIESPPGGGTRVNADLPLHRPSDVVLLRSRPASRTTAGSQGSTVSDPYMPPS